ncbi:hypothetical protein FPV67DRAFT_1667049 [Lyophyllum atratum]|nr:hypothetical protein FPV67DRAFT_1667049 [Lyophyllum atratum]
MDRHALAILEVAEAWNWPAPSCMETPEDHSQAHEFKTVCRKLLSCFVMESHRLRGTLLEQFWNAVERCHPQFSENVQRLRTADYSCVGQTEQTLFDGVESATVEFTPVFELAADVFTHVGLAFVNSENRQIWRFFSPPTGTNARDDPGKEPHHTQSQESLKLSALKRDGTSCPLTKMAFFGMEGVDPILMHVIPDSVRSKPDTLKYIAVLGGRVARDKVLEFANTIDNVWAMEANVAAAHRLCKWGIEACCNTDDPSRKHGKVEYVLRTFSFDSEQNIGSTRLRDGDEIRFGDGPEGPLLRCGPHPLLCNVRLAVGRALYTSGAAEFITRLMEDADESNRQCDVLKDRDFENVLDAKLLISGRAQIVEPSPVSS